MALSIGQATPTSVRSANSDPTKKKKTTHSATAASPTPNSLKVPKASVRSMSVRSKTEKSVEELQKACESAQNLRILATTAGLTGTNLQPYVDNVNTAVAALTGHSSNPDLTEEIAVYTARKNLAEKQAALKAQLLTEGAVIDFNANENPATIAARTAVNKAIKDLKKALDDNSAVDRGKAENQINEANKFTDLAMVKEFRNIHGFETGVRDYSLKFGEYLLALKGKTSPEITAAKEAFEASIGVITARAKNLAQNDRRINVTNALFKLDAAKIKFETENRRINDLNATRGGDPENHDKIDSSFAENVANSEAELVKAFGLGGAFQAREEAFKTLDPAKKATVEERGKALRTISEAEKNITQQLELGLTAPYTAELKTLVDEIVETRKTEHWKVVDEHITKVKKEYEEAVSVLEKEINKLTKKKEDVGSLHEEIQAVIDAEFNVNETVDFLKVRDSSHADIETLRDLVTAKETAIGTVVDASTGDTIWENLKGVYAKAGEKSNPSVPSRELQELTDKYGNLEREFADLRNNPAVQAGNTVNTVTKTVSEIKPFNYEEHVPKEVRDKLEQVSTHKPNTLLTVGIAAGAAAISWIMAYYFAAISGNTKKDDKKVV